MVSDGLALNVCRPRQTTRPGCSRVRQGRTRVPAFASPVLAGRHHPPPRKLVGRSVGVVRFRGIEMVAATASRFGQPRSGAERAPRRRLSPPQLAAAADEVSAAIVELFGAQWPRISRFSRHRRFMTGSCWPWAPQRAGGRRRSRQRRAGHRGYRRVGVGSGGARRRLGLHRNPATALRLHVSRFMTATSHPHHLGYVFRPVHARAVSAVDRHPQPDSMTNRSPKALAIFTPRSCSKSRPAMTLWCWGFCGASVATPPSGKPAGRRRAESISSRLRAAGQSQQPKRGISPVSVCSRSA